MSRDPPPIPGKPAHWKPCCDGRNNLLTVTNSPLQSGWRLPQRTAEPAGFSEFPGRVWLSFLLLDADKNLSILSWYSGLSPSFSEALTIPISVMWLHADPRSHHAPQFNPNNMAISPPLPHLLLAVAENTKMFPAQLFFSQQNVIISLIKLSFGLPCKSVLNSFVNETTISKGNLNFPGNMGMP